MEYVFGYESTGGVVRECVKVISENGTDLIGSFSVERSFDDQTIMDDFVVVRKYRSREEGGRVYDWYEIKDHYRYTDRFTPGIRGTEQEITDIEIAQMEQEQEITDHDIAIMELQERLGA